MNTYLEQCPFCGSENVELITGKGKFDRVQCKYCGATGPWFDGHPEDAISGWNHLVLPRRRPVEDDDYVEYCLT